MITFNVSYPSTAGPLVHTPSLFVFETVNEIDPSLSNVKFTRAIEVHDCYTRYAVQGNLFSNSARTVRYGLKSLNVEVKKFGQLFQIILKIYFNANYKRLLIDSYL